MGCSPAQAASEPRRRQQSRLGEEAGGAAGGTPPALGGVGDQQPVLGAGRGDVEQPALLRQPLGIGRGQRAPGGQQLVLAAEQHDELGLGALRPVNRAHRDSPVGCRVDLLGVQSRGVLEEAGERRVLVVLLVRLGGAAQRAQVLEHPLGVGPSLGVRRVVAVVLVVAHESAGQRHRGDHRVSERAARVELGSDVIKSGAELDEAITRRLAGHSIQTAGVCAGGDQVAAVVLARPGRSAGSRSRCRRRAAVRRSRGGTPARRSGSAPA